MKSRHAKDGSHMSFISMILLKSASNISAKKSLYTIYLNNLKSIIMCVIFPGNCTSFTNTIGGNFSAYLKFLMNLT